MWFITNGKAIGGSKFTLKNMKTVVNHIKNDLTCKKHVTILIFYSFVVIQLNLWFYRRMLYQNWYKLPAKHYIFDMLLFNNKKNAMQIQNDMSCMICPAKVFTILLEMQCKQKMICPAWYILHNAVYIILRVIIFLS